MIKNDPEMQGEYDLSGGERGKFYKKGTILVPPVHLNDELLAYYQKIARNKGQSLNELINQVLKKDMELNEPVL